MPITTVKQAITNVAKGLGHVFLAQLSGPGSAVTAAVANSGFHTMRPHFNALGTTLPSTRQSIPRPTSPPQDLRFMWAQGHMANSAGCWLCFYYLMGTVNLGATGNQFTAAGGVTYPLLRTQFGEASKALVLTPVIQITTAPTVTAPAFIVRTNPGSAGYVDQDANSTTGTVTTTLPSATTAINSVYCCRINQSDSGVQSISQIDVTTAGTSSPAGTIWGIELLAPLGTISGAYYTYDGLLSGLCSMNLNPAVATSGTVSAYLGMISIGQTTTSIDPEVFLCGALNT